MTDSLPPLPKLEILESTKKVSDQATVDKVLNIVYEQKPDLLARIAEQEKQDLGITFVADDLDRFLREDVGKRINIPGLHVKTCITREIRRRVRVMYGLPI